MKDSGKAKPPEIKMETVEIPSKLIDDARNMMGLKHMVGGFFPEGDALDMLALYICKVTGRLKK